MSVPVLSWLLIVHPGEVPPERPQKGVPENTLPPDSISPAESERGGEGTRQASRPAPTPPHPGEEEKELHAQEKKRRRQPQRKKGKVQGRKPPLPPPPSPGTFSTPKRFGPRLRCTQPLEPIFFPKLQIYFADFPYLHYSID